MINFEQYVRLAQNKFIERMLVTISMLILANLLLFPSPIFADTESSSTNSGNLPQNYQLVPVNQGDSLIEILNPEVMLDGSTETDGGHLPENRGLNAKYTVTAIITAYNSDSGQTDNSPCITASGFDLCKHAQEDSVAINGFKLGTKVRFPDLFGDRVFVVRDRMNARYGSSHVDVWMLSKADAKIFGVKVARMEVLE